MRAERAVLVMVFPVYVRRQGTPHGHLSRTRSDRKNPSGGKGLREYLMKARTSADHHLAADRIDGAYLT